MTWQGPRLLVPISVDALVLGQRDLAGFAQAGPDYTQLRSAKSPTAKPFQPAVSTGLPQLGVSLHWNMPLGLRSGQTQSSDDGSGVSFPTLPNRWLLIRSYTPSGAPAQTAPTLKAWLLRSDVDVDDGGVPFPADEAPYYTFIGQPIELNANVTDAPSTVQRIFAMGPGEPSYAVVFQGTQGVLGFNDPLSDVGSGTLGYVALGSYNPAQWDPLLGVSTSAPNGFSTSDQWHSLMQGLSYTVGDGTETDLSSAQASWQAWATAHAIDSSSLPTAQQTLPAQMLLCGGVQKIVWQGADNTYGSQVPNASAVEVAVGNTATEAIGAWLTQRVGTQPSPPNPSNYSVERLIQALALDQINTFITDPVALENAAQADTFGSLAGGSTWVVARPDTGFEQNRSFQADQSVPLDAEQTQGLVTLCAAQSALEQVTRALSTRRWELYACQWKATQPSSYRAQVQAALTTLTAQVAQLVSDQTAASSRVESARSQLADRLGSTYTLSLRSLPSFDLCTDPVVLIAGAEPDDTLLQVDADGNPVALPCRVTGQTLTELHVTVAQQSAPLATTELASALDLGFLALAPLPIEARDVLLETLLLDPGVLSWLASTWIANGGAGVNQSAAESAISAIQQGLRSASALDASLTPALVGAVLAVGGTPPAPVQNHVWVQPWCPLYLDWELEWHPTSLTVAGAMSGWQLGETDYAWTQPSVSTTAITYQGRSLLNSNAPSVLASRITQFLTTPAGKTLPIYQKTALSSVAQALTHSGVLTQSLSGLTDMLVQRVPGRASGAVADAASPDNSVLPNPPLRSDEADMPFQPVRAGHFLIKKIWVVDAYGQVLQVQQNTGNIVPLCSAEVTTQGAGNESYVQLPPRLAQPSRLNLTLVDADDDATVSNSSDATSAVCGYLVPSYLDGGLLVFDASGAALGLLLPVIRDGSSKGVRWDAAPGSDAPLGAQPRIANEHLLHLVNGVLSGGRENVSALDELLTLIDGSNVLSDPTFTNSGQLGLLIGAPLAVVRATVGVELFGDPVYDQAYSNTGKNLTGGMPQLSVPARIGDLGIGANGVVGYFANDRYDSINAAYGYSAQATRQLRASVGLTVSAAGDYVIEDARLPLGPVLDTGDLATGASTSQTPVTLTVLMAPRGLLPAITGQHPVQTVALPPGPVTQALSAMALTFRAGPLLVQPARIRMPLPADIRGEWALTWRDSVTTWTDGPVHGDPATARLVRKPLRLTEGWLELSGALKAQVGG